MTFFVLASVKPAPPVSVAEYDSRRLWLESWDGDVVLPVPLDNLPHALIGQRGFLGLGVNPADLVTAGTPGVPGSRVVDVVQTERPVALPLAFLADDQFDLWATVQTVRDMTDPSRGMTADGNFRIVCTSSSGTRQLSLAYRSGLEGEDTEHFGADTAVLDCVAPMPYAADRVDQSQTFQLAADTAPFLGGIWGDVYLSSSTIAGAATPVEMHSSVPVYPVIEITGPADSVLLTAESGLRVDVPLGIAAGSTLRIVTDPREKSIRLNGAPAAGLLARGSRLVPFGLGATLVDVDVPGATGATQLRLTWRGLHRSLW